MLLNELFNQGPRLYPEKIGIVDGNRRFTYRELGNRWNRLANALISLGLRKGDYLGIILKNSAEAVDAYAATAKIGAVLAPVNYRLDPNGIKGVLNGTRCRVLIADHEFVGIVNSIRQDLPFLKVCISVGSVAEGMLEYESLLNQYPPLENEISVSEDDPYVAIFTSGTTGVPKGAVASRKTTMYRVYAMSTEFPMTPDDHYIVIVPLFHVGGNMPALTTIYRSATLIIMRDWDAAEFCRLVQDEKVTKSILTPVMLNFVLNLPDVSRYDLSSFQKMQYGGSPIAMATLNRIMNLMPKCQFQNAYGTSECCTSLILRPNVHEEAIAGSTDALRRLGSIGKEAVIYRVRVVNEEGLPVKPGEVGEIVMNGPQIMTGYLNNPEETSMKLKDGWFHSGDLATVDEEGYVFLIDRKHNMIITGGENVYPAQVENEIFGHPKVAEVAVFGVPDEKWGESVKAVVVVKKGETLTREELINFCKDKMANYAKPKYVDFTDELPHLATGKVDRISLKNKYLESGGIGM